MDLDTLWVLLFFIEPNANGMLMIWWVTTRYPKFSARRFIRENGEVSTLYYHQLYVSTLYYHQLPCFLVIRTINKTKDSMFNHTNDVALNIRMCLMPLVYTTNYLYFSFSIVYHSPDICLWIGWTLSVWSQAHCWNISSVSSVDLPKSTINANIWKTCAKLWAPQHWCRRQSTSRHSGAPPCPSARPPQHPRSYSACASIVETVWIKNSTIFKNVLVSWYIQMKLKIVLTNLFVNSAMSRSQSEEQLRMFSDDVDLWEFFSPEFESLLWLSTQYISTCGLW